MERHDRQVLPVSPSFLHIEINGSHDFHFEWKARGKPAVLKLFLDTPGMETPDSRLTFHPGRQSGYFGDCMSLDYSTLSLHLVSALGAGAVIGLERTIHGHPAGFRTHVLVCLACSLLMLMTLYQPYWLSGASVGSIGADTSRMAQGIMTGIGFLGAGVIFKEGISIRGLTTAASIWITAAIGILLGLGFYFPAVLGTGLTLAVLTLFNSIEKRLPRQSYAQYHVSFDRNNVLPESDVRKLVIDHGFSIANMSYRVTQAGLFEYRMDINTTHDPDGIANLAATLRTSEMVREFRISTTGT